MDTVDVKDADGLTKKMLTSGDGLTASTPFSSISKDWFQAVAEGGIDGYSIVEKFGENPDIDTSTDPEDVWSHGGLYTFSTSADIDSVSSSSASDTNEITIQGLDANWDTVTQTATLNGQTRVALTTPLIRCFRAWNSNSTDWAGDVHVYVNTALSGGVPIDPTKVRAEVTIGSGQTEMCIYTIPAGKTGYFLGGYTAMSRVGNNSAVFTSKLRTFGGVFRTVSRISCIGGGASNWSYRYPVGLAIPEKSDLLIRCEEVDANNTGVSGGFTILLKDNA